MEIRPFALERWQSHHEHDVAVNLSDSGVHPVDVAELVPDPEERDKLLNRRLGYTQTNGTLELRTAIASMFEGATPSNVLVTTGGAEANFLSAWSLLNPGDEAVILQPNYQQLWGIAESMGAAVRGWSMSPDRHARVWNAEVDALDEVVTDSTKLIAICTPNNPTGAQLSDAVLDGVVAAAERVGAWILSDEIYRGTEYSGQPSPSLWGRTDKIVITSSLSKAFGLPGLRVGWMVSQPQLVDAAWTRHDYTSIAPAALSDALATHALQPGVRTRLWSRGRRWLSINREIVSAWVDARDDVWWAPPAAGAMAWIDTGGRDSLDLVERARVRESVLVVPGEHYEAPGWIRVGFGGEPAELTEGLARLGRVLDA